MSYTGTIKIPVLFDMSGDTIVYGEDVAGDFVTSHLDFILDMTTEANDISLNAADISAAILVGDQDNTDNLFYSGESDGNVAVDNLCNRISKAITRGKLVHIPKAGNHSNSGIPLGGRAELVDATGTHTVYHIQNEYTPKYFTTVAPIGDEQMLGEAMARVASIHLVGTPLAAAAFEDAASIQTSLETASSQTFNSGNTAFYNALAVQLSKVLGGSKSSAPMNNGGGYGGGGADLTSQIYYEDFEDQAYDGTITTAEVVSGGYKGNYALKGDSTQNNKYWWQTTSDSLPSNSIAVSFWHYAVKEGSVDIPQLLKFNSNGNYFAMDLIGSNVKYYISNTINITKWYLDGTDINASGGTTYVDTTLNAWHHHYMEFNTSPTELRWMGHTTNDGSRYRGTGLLDEVRIFNAHLSASQIADLAAGNNGNVPIGYPLDASGVSVPALKSIYEQLMNVPGRSQIMPTRDISGVQDNSNVTVVGGFPFISGDKLVMYLRPKIVFAAQTQAEDNNALYTFNYTGKTILAIPAYSISDKTGIITTQTYTHSSSQNNTTKIFEHSTDGNGIIGTEFWHSATNSYNNTTGVHEGANANGTTTNVDVANPPAPTTTTHTVTVGDNGGNKFKIDDAFNPILAFVKGNTYIFDQSDATNSGHQIQISETSGGANTSYATTVGTPGTAGAKTTVVVPSNAPATLYYNCNPHGAGMGNSIGVTSPPNSISGEWGQVDIGENTWATELKLTSNNGNNDSPPREFRLLGSTNGTDWITLIHETEAGPWVDNVTQTFTIATQGSYRYYRYVVIKCYNAVSAGNINSQTTIGHFNLRGAKYPSETAENSDLAFMDNSPLDISGLQTNVVSSSTSIQSAFPGNATNGPEAEPSKWGWMGSTNSDSFTLDSTDFTDPRTIDLHIWKITITL